VKDEDVLIRLMAGYQAGDAGAFEEFYHLVRHRLYQFLLVKTLDSHWAEDLLQETFLQIHRSRRTYQPGRPVAPWIFAIARHIYLMSLRSRRRHEVRETQLEDILSDFPAPDAAGPAADLSDVRKALAILPQEQREALLLFHYWGLTFKEIGATLGIREGTAKQRAHRGLQRIKEQLKSEDVTQTGPSANSKESRSNAAPGRG
jgi:RNA polymerase sigma-70 factor (ECF subfamily)